jgi:hypothetical protein
MGLAVTFVANADAWNRIINPEKQNCFIDPLRQKLTLPLSDSAFEYLVDREWKNSQCFVSTAPAGNGLRLKSFRRDNAYKTAEAWLVVVEIGHQCSVVPNITLAAVLWAAASANRP